jgi:hypothetical protein
MAFIPVPNTAQFNIRQTYLGERIENTLYARNPTGWTPVALANIATILRDWYTTQLRAPLSNQLVLREVYAVDLASVSGPTATVSVTNDPGGAGTAQPMPGSVALCVSLRTANRGRSFRGRNYVAGFTEDHVNGNQFTSSIVTSITTAYDGLLAVFSGGGVEWVVVSRFSNGLPRTTGIATAVTDALVVDSNVDSQRRRLAGRGA